MSRKNKEFRLKELVKLMHETSERVKYGQRTLSLMENEHAKIVQSLATKKKDISVSDHALIRYLERKCGFDFDRYRDDMLTPTVIRAIKAGADSVSVDNMKYYIKDNVIVTAI